MKKKNFRSNLEILDKFNRYLEATYLPLDPNDRNMVSERQQIAEIEKLSNSIRSENSFFITNVLDFSVSFSKNMEIIGTDAKTVNLQYLNLTGSEGFLEISFLYKKILLEFGLQNPNQLGFLKPQFISQIPIKRANGDIVLVKKTLSPFQYTSSGKILSNLAEFTIIKENYNNESMEPRFLNFPEAVVLSIKELVFERFINEYSPFSPKEIVIMKAFNQNPDFNLTQLSLDLNISFETLKSYNKSIITKAKEYMGPLFSLKNAKDISNFFDRSGVI